jgi:rhodanese-related sulfurtransferase
MRGLKMKKRIVLLALIGISVLLVACADKSSTPGETTGAQVVGEKVTAPGGTYMDVSVADLQIMLASKDFTFVNVHIPFEGDIAGTDLSIPYDQIEQNLSLLPASKDAKIVLYCRSGRMSSIAAETLVSLGYTNVWNLKGGMVDWEKAGLPLER